MYIALNFEIYKKLIYFLNIWFKIKLNKNMKLV